MASVEEYWKEQQESNGFKGDLKAFIKEYGFEFDVWFIEQNFDLKGVQDIAVYICW